MIESEGLVVRSKSKQQSHRIVDDSQFGHVQQLSPGVYRAARLSERHLYVDPDSSVLMTRRAQELAIKEAYWKVFRTEPEAGSSPHRKLKMIAKERKLKSAEVELLTELARRARHPGNDVAHKDRLMRRADALEANGCLWELTKQLLALVNNTGIDADLKFNPDEAKRIAELKNSPRIARELAAELKKVTSERDSLRDGLGAMAAGNVTAARRDPEINTMIDDHDLSAEHVAGVIADSLGLPNRAHALEPLRAAIVLERLEPWGFDGRQPAAASFADHDGSPAGIDFALLDRAGVPLAILETTLSLRSLPAGMAHAEAVADLIETTHGVRPVVFASNGFDNIRRDPGSEPVFVADFDTYEALTGH